MTSRELETLPVRGSNSPKRSLSNVDLPQPFLPTMATRFFAALSSETSTSSKSFPSAVSNERFLAINM